MKNGFVVYNEYREHLALLKDADLGRLMRAIFAFADGEQPDKLPAVAGMAYSFITAQMARDMAKYEATCERNRRNGKLGGRPRKEQPADLPAEREPELQADIPAGERAIQEREAVFTEHAPQQEYLHHSETDGRDCCDDDDEPCEPSYANAADELEMDDGYYASLLQEAAELPTRGAAASQPPAADIPQQPTLPPLDKQKFNRFWAAYPRKQSRGSAENFFEMLNPDEQLLQSMLSALEKAAASDEWKRDNGRFIPLAGKWLNNRGWLDEHTPAPAKHGYIEREYSAEQLEALATPL